MNIAMVDASLGGTEKWFRDSLAPFVIKFRVLIIVLCFVTGAICVTCAMQLRPSVDVPELFPRNHNVQMFLEIKYVRARGLPVVYTTRTSREG